MCRCVDVTLHFSAFCRQPHVRDAHSVIRQNQRLPKLRGRQAIVTHLARVPAFSYNLFYVLCLRGIGADHVRFHERQQVDFAQIIWRTRRALMEIQHRRELLARLVRGQRTVTPVIVRGR